MHDLQIAKEAEFFSFGTNDLTQMTFGYSRDDVGKFLPTYLAQGILQNDPFEVSLVLTHPWASWEDRLCYKKQKFPYLREWRKIETDTLTAILQLFCLQVLDQRGVGQLIKIATERGRAARPSLKVNGNFAL